MAAVHRRSSSPRNGGAPWKAPRRSSPKGRDRNFVDLLESSFRKQVDKATAAVRRQTTRKVQNQMNQKTQLLLEEFESRFTVFAERQELLEKEVLSLKDENKKLSDELLQLKENSDSKLDNLTATIQRQEVAKDIKELDRWTQVEDLMESHDRLVATVAYLRARQDLHLDQHIDCQTVTDLIKQHTKLEDSHEQEPSDEEVDYTCDSTVQMETSEYSIDDSIDYGDAPAITEDQLQTDCQTENTTDYCKSDSKEREYKDNTPKQETLSCRRTRLCVHDKANTPRGPPSPPTTPKSPEAPLAFSFLKRPVSQVPVLRRLGSGVGLLETSLVARSVYVGALREEIMGRIGGGIVYGDGEDRRPWPSRPFPW